MVVSQPGSARDAERRLTAAQESVIDACYHAILPAAPVAQHTSFFDIGGDSIQLIKLVQLVQRELGIPIHLPDFLLTPTRAVLTEAILASVSRSSRGPRP